MNRRPASLPKSPLNTKSFLRRARARFAVPAVALTAGLALFANPGLRAANTEDDVKAGATDLGANTTTTYNAVAGTTSDVTFAASTTYASASNFALGTALSIGSLNDLNATAITINGTAVLTLNDGNGTSNVVAPAGTNGGSALDALFVANGASLTINDSAGILLTSKNSNFDAVGTGVLNLGTTGITVVSSFALGFTGSGTISVGGVISGTTGAVTINDTGGSTTFSGANTYTGATTVTAGTLKLSGSLGATAIAVNGGTFTETGAGVIGSTATLTTTGGTTSLSGANTYSGATSVNGGTLTLDFSTATTPASATNIIKTGNTINLGGGTFALKGGGVGDTNSQTFGATNFTTLTASKINVNSNGGTLNLALGGLTRNAQSSVDITLPATGTVSTTSNNTLGGLLTDSSKVAYVTANGGTTWAAESGATPFPITAYSAYSSTYTTATNNVDVANGDAPAAFTINTLRFNAATDALTLTGTNVLNAGGILITPTATAASISGSGTLTSGTTNTNAELVIHNYGGLNIGAVLANNGAKALNLTLTGSGGTTTLSAANTFSGQTALLTGTLNISNQLALQNSTLQFNAGPALVFDSSVAANAFTLGALAGTANIALVNNAGTPAPIALTVGGNNASTTYSGVLSGAGSLIKNGTGTLTVSQNQTYTGGLTINNGTVSAGNGLSAFGTTGTLTLGQAGSSNSVVYNTAGFNNPITVNGGAGSRTFTPNTGSSFTIGGAITFVSGGTLTINLSSATNTLTGGASGTGNLVTTGTAGKGAGLVLNTNPFNPTGYFQNTNPGSGSATINSVIGTNVTGVIENSATSGLFLTNVNTFPGDTTITSGTVNLRNTLALQNSVVVTNSTAGTLTFGTSATVGLASATLGGLSGTGNVALNDTLTSPGAVALTIGNSNVSNGSTANPNTLNPTYAGVLSNGTSTSAASVTKVGSNTQTFTGANTYTGTTAVTGGTLALANTTGKALTATSTIAVNNGGTLLFSQPNQVNTAPITVGTAAVVGPPAVAATTGILSFASGANQGTAETLTGGMAAGGPTTAGLGALTLNNTATLAFGGASTTLVFGTFTPNGNVLNVTGYTNMGTATAGNSGTGTDDRLIFSGDQQANFNDFNFGAGAGVGVGEVALDGGFFEITAVPEPSTWTAGITCLGMMGVRLLVGRRKSRRGSRALV